MADIDMEGTSASKVGDKRSTPEVGEEDAVFEFKSTPTLKKGKSDKESKPIDLSITGKSTISVGNYIAVVGDSDLRIVAIGYQNKSKNKIATFEISEDGIVGKRQTSVTPNEFISKYDHVLRTTETINLQRGNFLNPRKLHGKVEEIKNTPKPVESSTEDKLEKETTSEMDVEVQGDQPSENKVDETTEILESTQDVSQVKILDPTTVPVVEDETVVPEKSEETKDENEDLAVLVGGTSEPPKEKPPTTRLTIMETQLSRLLEHAENTTDVDLSQMYFEKAGDLQTRIDTYKNMPTELKKAEKDNEDTRKAEMETVEDNTTKQRKSVAKESNSPQQQLSTENIVAPITVDASTGGAVDMEIDQVLDSTSAGAVEDKPRIVNGLVSPTEVDTHNGDVNESVDNVLLGSLTRAHEDVIMEGDGPGTSANAQIISNIQSGVQDDMEQVVEHGPGEGVAMDESMSAEEIQAQLELDKLDAKMNEMDQSPTSGDIDGAAFQALVATRKILVAQVEKLKTDKALRSSKLQSDPRNVQDITGEESAKKTAHEESLAQIRKGIPDFAQTAAQLHGRPSPFGKKGSTVPFDQDSLAHNKKLYVQMLKDNQIRDLRTSQAPSIKQLFGETVDETGNKLQPPDFGTTGLGTPVFVPAESRNNLYDIYTNMTVTDKEAVGFRKEMVPLWDEFKRGRVHAGVSEMMAMPTRLLRSDQSSIKNGQRLRTDIKEQDETFGYFMYWLLHDKLDTSRLYTWRSFLGFAASMGYNDLSQADINWMITGNPDGNQSSNTNFKSIEAPEGEDSLDVSLDIFGNTLTRSTLNHLHAQVIGNPEPQVQYPSRNTSPSASPIDHSIHPDGSSFDDRKNRRTFAGLPNSVVNIPDPRVSKRGGQDVPNVRLVTKRNPKYDPIIQKKLKPGDPLIVPEFITEEVPDIGAGSKDIGAMIQAAQSDRLISSLPSKLYAPIHAQAVDRYLGAKNYQRLSLSLERYMKSYSQHPWGPTDFQDMFNWNTYTMALYGQMLYAFVTDIQMQRNSPVFDMSEPEGVGIEYMELNELIAELASFQQKSEDRGTRVDDANPSRNSIEDHLNNFYEGRDSLDKQKMAEGNAVIISTDDLPPIPSSVTPGDVTPDAVDPVQPEPGPVIPQPVVPPPNPWGPGPDPRIYPDQPYSFPDNDVRSDPSIPLHPEDQFDPNDRSKPHLPPSTLFSTMAGKSKPPVRIGVREMDNGIKRGSMSGLPDREHDPIVNSRKRMFDMFHGR